MWTGQITALEPPTPPNPWWIVWIETPEGGIYKDGVTEEVYNGLEIGQEWTLTNPQPLES